MSPLASRNDELNPRDALPSMSMGLNVDPEWGVPHSATPTPTGTPALGQKDYDRRIKRKYVAYLQKRSTNSFFASLRYQTPRMFLTV